MTVIFPGFKHNMWKLFTFCCKKLWISQSSLSLLPKFKLRPFYVLAIHLRFQGDMERFSVTTFIMAVNEVRCSKRTELPELLSGCIEHTERQLQRQVARQAAAAAVPMLVNGDASLDAPNWPQTHSQASSGASQWIHTFALHDSCRWRCRPVCSHPQRTWR